MYIIVRREKVYSLSTKENDVIPRLNASWGFFVFDFYNHFIYLSFWCKWVDKGIRDEKDSRFIAFCIVHRNYRRRLYERQRRRRDH